MPAEPTSFEDFCTIDQTAPNIYESRYGTWTNSFSPGEKVGYGGCTLAIAIVMAYASVKDTYRLYTCQGLFLGAAIAGIKLQGKVSVVRDTRTFATRMVEISQIQNGTVRAIASMYCDFQAQEESHPRLRYDAPPRMVYSGPEEAWDDARMRAHGVEMGLSGELLDMVDTTMVARKAWFDVRSPVESFGTATVFGMFPALEMAQKGLGMTEKTTCYYWRSYHPTKSAATNAAAIAFLADAGMPVTPLSFAKVPFTDMTRPSSLDFALRFFANDIDAHTWLKREEQTIVGAAGRVYSEARVWDDQGNLIASMTEQCLLRARSDRKTKL